jgi:hypothetical protein
VIGLALVLALQLPLAADGQHAVLQTNVHVLRLDLGEVELEGDALGVLEDVDRGGPAVRLGAPGETEAAVEQPGHLVLQTREVARRVPALHGAHVLLLFLRRRAKMRAQVQGENNVQRRSRSSRRAGARPIDEAPRGLPGRSM